MSGITKGYLVLSYSVHSEGNFSEQYYWTVLSLSKMTIYGKNHIVELSSSLYAIAITDGPIRSPENVT